MSDAEFLASVIKRRHRLSSLHIFDQDGEWRVFGFRKEAQGFQASVEQGRGNNIAAALQNLDTRLIEGPVHK